MPRRTLRPRAGGTRYAAKSIATEKDRAYPLSFAVVRHRPKINSRRLIIWTAVFEFLVTLIAAALVWKFVTRLIGFQSKPAEPDDSINVMARLRPRPKAGAGAVALAEPEYDDEEQE